MECVKCDWKWRPGHKYSKGATLAYARKRIQRRDSAAYIVADLAGNLKCDLHENDSDYTLTMINKPSITNTFVAFDQRVQNMSSLTSTNGIGGEDLEIMKPIDKADQNIFVTKLDAAMGKQHEITSWISGWAAKINELCFSSLMQKAELLYTE